jgi:membrane-associated phospholipid phosphatase
MHTSAWGSVFTFAIIAASMNMQNAFFLMIASILIGGLVGSARLYLQAHNIRQIWIGYILGVLGQILSFLIIKIAFF